MTDPATLTVDVDADEFATACEDVADAVEQFVAACDRLEETSVTLSTGHGDPTEIPATDLVDIEASINVTTGDSDTNPVDADGLRRSLRSYGLDDGDGDE